MTKRSPVSGVTTNETLESLPAMSREELLERWAGHFKLPPPKAASRPLLERAVAYAMQERQSGGLSSRSRRDLIRIAGQSNGRKRREIVAMKAHGNKMTARPRRTEAATLSLQPGMRLVREWQGRSHVVDVQKDGFVWNGKTYRSLSSVASGITGAKWSGPRFFRL